MYDAHGDTKQLTNASGIVTWDYTYDAFGNELDLSNDIVDTSTTIIEPYNPFRYCGEYFDQETGFVYLRARYYSPEIGRFVSEDTHWNIDNLIYGDREYKAGEVRIPDINAILQSGNLFAYCINNPIVYTDACGQHTKKGTPPPPSSGFVPKKGKKTEETWNKNRGGWEDEKGNIWKPDTANHGRNRETGDEEHWDVERGDGKGYVNVGKNGNMWGGKGKKPNLPQKKIETNNLNTGKVARDVAIVAVIGYGIWQVGKWTIATFTAIPTGGSSLALAAIVP